MLPKSIRKRAVLAALLVVASGPSAFSSATASAQGVPFARDGGASPHGAVTDHVIVVSIDGLRPDAIERYNARTLQRLMAEGAYATDAQTIQLSKTLPSHVSMLTGVPMEVHGITWNDDRTDTEGLLSTTTIFEVARENGFSTAAFFSKSKFRHFEKPGALDYSQAPRGIDTWMATKTVVDAISYMRGNEPGLMFVHIGEPDYAGHTVGFMSFAYGWAVRRADGALGSLLEAADATYGPGGYTVIVTSDHGGTGRKHGADTHSDRNIPWIAWGRGVEPGVISSRVNTMDTAATALWLLGLTEPVAMTGDAVVSAFTPSARLAANAATTTPVNH